MNIVLLGQVGGFLKPFAWFMGMILNAIYVFIGWFGIHNIALCIFLFTFVMKMLMLPLTVKQQKFTRLSSKMNPELTKIQEKYRGKKDEESLRRQQAETQAVYSKYGSSPMGGCLPLLITLPIMFALYRVIYAIPFYINDVGALYGTVADSITTVSGHADLLTNFIANNNITLTADITDGLTKFVAGTAEYKDTIIDILLKFTTGNWDSLFLVPEFAALQPVLADTVENIISVNGLFGLSILDIPQLNTVSIIIPILAVASQFLQTKLQNVGMDSSKSNQDNPMASTTKTMSIIFPLMSGIFCMMMPIGVGVYWIALAIFSTVQTIFINKYLDKVDINEMIEKNVEKANKKKAKLGVDYGNKMAEVAKTSTKSYDTEFDSTSYKKNNKKKSISGVDYQRSDVSFKASSIAANANLLASRNSVAKSSSSEDAASPASAPEDQN